LLTPDDGDAATTSWPCRRRMVTSFFPMSPLPPITTTFMTNLLGCRPQVAGGWNAEPYSTSATDQRASLSGLLVMYTARTPPAMHRATPWMAAPPAVNTTPGAPFTVTACISRAPYFLLNTPARNRAARSRPRTTTRAAPTLPPPSEWTSASSVNIRSTAFTSPARHAATKHDRSSDGPEAISPPRNKDEGGGVFCDRADENSEKSEPASGAV